MTDVPSEGSGGRLRIVLIAAIVLTAAGGMAVQFLLQAKRDQVEAAREDPARRAAEAIQQADRAVVNGDLTAADAHLARADELLGLAVAGDEGGRARDPEILRAWLSVADRRAHLAAEAGRAGIAVEQHGRAAARAIRVLEVAPDDPRARVEALTTARKSADALSAASRAREALGALNRAAGAVDGTLGGLPAGAALRQELAEVAAARGRLHTEGTHVELALEAWQTALDHAAAAQSGAEDPAAALAQHAALAAEAADAAEGLKDAAAADRWIALVLRLLEARRALSPDDDDVARALSAWHLRAADRAAEANPEGARAGYDEAIGIRRALLAEAPDDPQRTQDLARALNNLARLHSRARQNREAIAVYREVVDLARGLPAEEQRTLVVALGNLSQVQGRIDQMRSAKRAASEAWTLARERAGRREGDHQAAVDAALAALRHARLLRAKPNPRRRAARSVVADGFHWLAKAPRDHAGAPPVRRGLDALARELGER